MCVIMIGKVGMWFHEKAKETNPHGFSCFTKTHGLVKSPTDKQVREAVKEFGIWHYRIASSGEINEENIHPFPVAHGKAYLYHNGILGEGTKEHSDTNLLARTLYSCSIETCKSVLSSLSSGQKLLLVDSKDPTSFRLYGDWKVHKGIIMSNLNHVRKPVYYYGNSAYNGRPVYSLKEFSLEGEVDDE